MRHKPEWHLNEAGTNKTRVSLFRQLVGDGEGRRLLDLGCGPGIFARSARDLGWKVTAVDARTFMLDGQDMDGIEFIQSDVREFDPSGFDTIANLGLLYHLPLKAQRELLQRCSYTRVILETQVHTHGVVPPAAEPWGHQTVSVREKANGVEIWPPLEKLHGRGRAARLWREFAYPRLSKSMRLSQGIVFRETHGERFENWRASVGNTESFWQTDTSLHRMFEQCGYKSVTTIEPPLYSVYGIRRYYVLNG